MTARLSSLMTRRGAVPLLIICLWAIAVFPNLSVRSFIWEEGTNAEIARDILSNGNLLQPEVYGVRWNEKPSLLPWLIAGVSKVTGEVNEFSARLPAMIAVVLTALLVQSLTRRYASLNASLLAALLFMFSPMLLQKLAIAEPDTLVTLFSFAAFVVWWNGVEASDVGWWRWIGCGLLLAVLAMAKGPQPVGYFALGVSAYVVVTRRWRDVPGLFVCLLIPAGATIAWAAAVYPARRRSDMDQLRTLAFSPKCHRLLRSKHTRLSQPRCGIDAGDPVGAFALACKRRGMEYPTRRTSARALCRPLHHRGGGLARLEQPLRHAVRTCDRGACRIRVGRNCGNEVCVAAAYDCSDRMCIDRFPDCACECGLASIR